MIEKGLVCQSEHHRGNGVNDLLCPVRVRVREDWIERFWCQGCLLKEAARRI